MDPYAPVAGLSRPRLIDRRRLWAEIAMRRGLSFSEVLVGARLVLSLPGLLRHPLDEPHALAILKERLAHREADFLALASRAIFANPTSPYLRLLRRVGCEQGDLARLLAAEGVDGALQQLLRQGIYLSVDEFKGRRPVVRGSSTFVIEPSELRNPSIAVYVPTSTAGSRSQGTPVAINLAFVREWAVNKCLVYAARGGLGWVQGRWSVPGSATIVQLLMYAAFGAKPTRWFSQVDPTASGLHPRYRWSERALYWGSWVSGYALPKPEYVPLSAPLPIAQWMASVLEYGQTPHLGTYVSSAVRVCEAAAEAGLSLRGARFSVGGEPITTARLRAIERVGAEAAPRYGTMEAGLIGDGCLRPASADDHHLYRDLGAFIQPGDVGKSIGLPVDSLLVSSLRASAPTMLLNVSLGDRATVASRACGCPLERLGWTSHLSQIRSFEKLTAGGMTFLDTDVVRVLEEVLPSQFGGGPTDYQLVEEEEDKDGRPRLRLLVDPQIGPLDSALVEEAFLGALGNRADAEQVMQLQWRQAGLLSVERRPPLPNRSGKILHLHQSSGA